MLHFLTIRGVWTISKAKLTGFLDRYRFWSVSRADSRFRNGIINVLIFNFDIQLQFHASPFQARESFRQNGQCLTFVSLDCFLVGNQWVFCYFIALCSFALLNHL